MIILTLKQTQPKHEVQRFSNKYNNNYIFELETSHDFNRWV